jgi:drug/metabolite transporter (DMT)-like permease
VFQPAALVMLAGSLFFAIQFIGTKKLSATESPMAVLFWMSVIQTPFCLAAALPDWTAPALADVPWILAIGTGSFTAHYCMTRAMKLADAMVIVPVDYFRLPLIAVVGAVFYGEAFDPMVFLGAGMIFAGVWFSLTRENRIVSS